MPSCLEMDAVVILAQLSDEPLTLLAHALDCERCQATLTETAVLRREGRVTLPTRSGFTDQVMRAVEAERTPPSKRRAWAWRPLLGGLYAALGFFATAAAGAAAPSAAGPALLLVCGLAAGWGMLAPGVAGGRAP